MDGVQATIFFAMKQMLPNRHQILTGILFKNELEGQVWPFHDMIHGRVPFIYQFHLAISTQIYQLLSLKSPHGGGKKEAQRSINPAIEISMRFLCDDGKEKGCKAAIRCPT